MQKGAKWAQNEFFSEFASIAYANREWWHLVGGSGQSAEKKCWGFVLGIMGQRGTTKFGVVAQFLNSDDPSNEASPIVTYFFI